MRIFINLTLTLVFLMGAGGLLHAKKMKGDDLSNMIIEGEDRLRVRGDIPPLDWHPDIYHDFPEVFKDDVLVGGLKSPAVKSPPVTLPKSSRSKVPASPWLRGIMTPPVLTLNTKPMAGEDKKVEWIFRVKDSKGKAFYDYKKKSILPRDIVWEGFSNRKRPLHVGYDYTYSLFIIDEAGNPQRFAGKPFNVKTFRYGKGEGNILHFYPESLFRNKSSLRFSRKGLVYLTETKDFLRLRYGRKVDIVVYDGDTKFALARANAIRNFLAEELTYPENRISAQGLVPAEGYGYRYVEIVAR